MSEMVLLVINKALGKLYLYFYGIKQVGMVSNFLSISAIFIFNIARKLHKKTESHNHFFAGGLFLQTILGDKKRILRPVSWLLDYGFGVAVGADSANGLPAKTKESRETASECPGIFDLLNERD
jgi:hypothetical protein